MSSPRAAIWLAGLGLPLLAAPAFPVEGAEALSLGVAPFEVEAPPGAVVPDMAVMLADRLGSRGVGLVVGPAQLDAARDAEPAEQAVREWATQAGVQAVVVGRTTRVGDELSVDVRLRAAESGSVSQSFVEQVSGPEELEGAVDKLATRVIDGTLALVAPSAAPEQAGEAGAQRGEAERSREDRTPFGFEGWATDEPLSIESDSLEAVQTDGRRRLVFEKNVRVVQGGMRITSSRLEAFYPESGSQPDRLVASGKVRVSQGDQRARCDKATYDRIREIVRCEGHARFEEGENQLSGREIEIDLRRETVRVRGGASILIHPETLENARTGEGAP